MRLTSWRPLAAALATAGWASAAPAQDVADFYDGKTVSFIISSSPGGGYDTLGRLLAKHLPKHIPGEPDVIVQNMPGAGGIVATNYLYNIAEKDGTVIGGVQNNTPFEPLYGTAEAQYDPLEFNWLGTPSTETGMLVVWKTVPVDSIEDVKETEITVGASGVNSTPSFYARLMNETLGTKLRVVPAFKGQNEMFMSMEQGELQGAPSVFYSSLVTTRPDWLPDGDVKVLVQYGLEKDMRLPDVPFGPDLVENAEDAALMEAAFAPLAIGRPYLMPPGVPEDRVEAMQTAFMETLEDPEFLAEADSIGLDVNAPRTGEQLKAVIERAYAAPEPVVARLRGLITAN